MPHRCHLFAPSAAPSSRGRVDTGADLEGPTWPGWTNKDKESVASDMGSTGGALLPASCFESGLEPSDPKRDVLQVLKGRSS